VRTGELAHERVRRRVAAHGQRREVQPGWPAFGPPDQGRKVALGEFGRHDRVDQLGGLPEIEPAPAPGQRA